MLLGRQRREVPRFASQTVCGGQGFTPTGATNAVARWGLLLRWAIGPGTTIAVPTCEGILLQRGGICPVRHRVGRRNRSTAR